MYMKKSNFSHPFLINPYLHLSQGDPGVEGLAGEKGEKVKSLGGTSCNGFKTFYFCSKRELHLQYTKSSQSGLR